ncbi:hypothetical protein JXA85_06850 [Candidatus Woesearchaeota archaeon]|nr:hypothetical protein [Candidatus Woesearchaeota archaeon]
MKKRTWIRLCPKCMSKKVDRRGMISEKAYSNNWVCLSCGYQSPLFPEVQMDEAGKYPPQPKRFMSSRLPIFADGAPRRKMWLIILICIVLYWIFRIASHLLSGLR